MYIINLQVFNKETRKGYRNLQHLFNFYELLFYTVLFCNFFGSFFFYCLIWKQLITKPLLSDSTCKNITSKVKFRRMSTNIFEFQKLLIPKKTATYNFEPTTSLKKMWGLFHNDVRYLQKNNPNYRQITVGVLRH